MRPVAALKRPRTRVAAEDGFTIVEVVVTGLVVVAAMIATFGALEAAGRAGSEQRHHTASYSIAQQDQARMRSLRVSELIDLDETREVVQEGTAYTVHSQAFYVSSTSGTASCSEGESPADYISIRTRVTWPSIGSRPPTAVESIVTPPNGAFGVDRGTLIVAARDATGDPIAGMSLAGNGAGSFSGQTNENGCAVFPNLPAGDYQLSPGAASGLVDRDGNAPGPSTVGVVDQSTNTVVLLFDDPGTVEVGFKTRAADGSIVAARSDAVVAFNTGMSVPKAYGTIGSPQTSIQAGLLFPFASPNTFYAGSCDGNNPNPDGEEDPPAAEAMASVNVVANDTVGTEVQLPALELMVQDAAGNPIEGAKVVITDNECEVGGQAVKRTMYTNGTGVVEDPDFPSGSYALPYGNYTICASAQLTWQEWSLWPLGWHDVSGYRRQTTSSVDVKTTDSNTELQAVLRTPQDGNPSQTGQCS